MELSVNVWIPATTRDDTGCVKCENLDPVTGARDDTCEDGEIILLLNYDFLYTPHPLLRSDLSHKGRGEDFAFHETFAESLVSG